MSVKEGETISKLLEYAFVISYPGGKKFTFTKEHIDNDECPTKTYQEHDMLGFSGSATLLRNETNLSDKWDASVVSNGPSIGGALGICYKNGFGGYAMIEPKLMSVDGKIGPILGSLGLKMNTGFKISEKGFQFLLFGFGFNCGIDGKFTLDTPLLSAGFSSDKRRFSELQLNDFLLHSMHTE